MKSKLFIISLIVVLFFGTAVYLAGYIGWYIDLPSFILVIILPYIAASVIFPPVEQKKYFRTLSGGIGVKDAVLTDRGLLFLKTLSSFSAGCTVVSVFIGLIAVLANISDKKIIGPGIAVTLICPFYYSLFYVMFILPFRGLLLRQKLEQ